MIRACIIRRNFPYFTASRIWIPGRSIEPAWTSALSETTSLERFPRFSFASNEPYMGIYHPKTNAGVVHYSTRDDLPAKKVFSWGSDAEGLGWRDALSDNHSAYVEIQAGLFRNQETYGFLGPQQSIHFTEIWLPILEIGGVTRANPDAVLNLTRTPSDELRNCFSRSRVQCHT